MQQYCREKHVRLFSQLLGDRYGIRISREKADMLKVKLQKLMTRNNIVSYDEYYELISGDGPYLTQFLDEITTHTTTFFRENSHFEYLQKNINNVLDRNRAIRKSCEIRAWSAACSTGEEPYTLAMVLRESLPEGINIKILATDISRKVVASAAKGVYALEIENEVGKYYIQNYFSRIDGAYQIADHIKSLVTFRTFNLMEPFPFKKQFDIIFCRNVMIYFNGYVQKTLVEKMYDALAPGGLFFIGHSEGLVHKENRFNFIQPSVYTKA